MCFLGTWMFLKLDYANICRGQTNAQQTIHKIIKQRLVVFYFHSISIGFYFHSICVSLNISQALWMPLSPQWFSSPWWHWLHAKRGHLYWWDPWKSWCHVKKFFEISLQIFYRFKELFWHHQNHNTKQCSNLRTLKSTKKKNFRWPLSSWLLVGSCAFPHLVLKYQVIELVIMVWKSTIYFMSYN